MTIHSPDGGAWTYSPRAGATITKSGKPDDRVPSLTVILEPGICREQADVLMAAITQLRGVERVTTGALTYTRELAERAERAEAERDDLAAELREMNPPPMAVPEPAELAEMADAHMKWVVASWPRRRPRVRLTADYTDEQGLPFRAGQEGCVVGLLPGDLAAVEFDGYEDAREANRLQRERTGEGYNVVPWAGLIPGGLLQALPPSPDGESAHG
jgi:hypothetical protein